MMQTVELPRSGQHPSRETLTQLVSDKLLVLMREEGLGEGDSIPPTADLVDRFGVSRTVVREALAELTGRGVIRRQQGREGIVSIPGSENLGSLFQIRMSHDGINLIQVHEVRIALEVGAARLAAMHAQRRDIAHLSDLLHAMHSATSEREMLQADVDFHHAIADIANPLFGLILDGLGPLLMESRIAVWSGYTTHGGKLEIALKRHTVLRDCIADQDGEASAAAMLDDLRDTHESIRRM